LALVNAHAMRVDESVVMLALSTERITANILENASKQSRSVSTHAHRMTVLTER